MSTSPEGTTAHGLRVLAWLVGGLAALSLLVDHLGLKYVQGVIWPTDLFAFEALPLDSRPDVVVMGSSRASFAITPSTLDACMTRRLDRPTRSFNLARAFATSQTFHHLTRDLLVDQRAPRLLILALAPEAVDDHNHRLTSDTASVTSLGDLPASIAAARTADGVIAATRPLGRGVETLALFAAGRHLVEARLRWLMVHHGGGQWCIGSDACTRQNHAFKQQLNDRWQRAEVDMLPGLTEERFADYAVGDGPLHDHLMALIALAAARDIQLGIVHLPLHSSFMEKIPPSVQQAYADYVAGVAKAHRIPLMDGNLPGRQDHRPSYVDPDHLAERAANKFTEAVCPWAVHQLSRRGDGGGG